MSSTNRVRAVREQRAMPQGRLAATAGVSRQALTAIEADRASPSVAVALRLANALSCTVEELFGESGDGGESIGAEREAGVVAGGPVLVGWLGERWVAHEVRSDTLARSIDGVATDDGRIALHRSKAELVDAVFIAGCAPALGALAERAQRKTGTLFRWLSRSSAEALRLLGDDSVHLGGIHLESNEAAVRRRLPRAGASLVTLASWEIGLVVPRGARSPKKMADLAQKRLRVAWREPGSGAHALATRLLREAGVPVDGVARRATALRTHLAVAQAVEAGFADVGFTIRAAALACGLDFVPQARERFDLVVTAAASDDRRIKALLDVVSDGGFRRELDASGYDTSASGERSSPEAA